MKQLYIALLALLICGQSLYGMKHTRFVSVKNSILSHLEKGDFSGAQKIHSMYRGVFPHFAFTSKEKSHITQSLQNEIKTINQQLVDNSFSILRSNCWWLLPASATVLALSNAPIAIGCGMVGSTLGSMGLKIQFDYIANSMTYTKLCEKAKTLETIFGTKESELK